MLKKAAKLIAFLVTIKITWEVAYEQGELRGMNVTRWTPLDVEDECRVPIRSARIVRRQG